MRALLCYTLSAMILPNFGTGPTYKEGYCFENELDVNVAYLDSVNALFPTASASVLHRGKEIAMIIYSLGICNFNNFKIATSSAVNGLTIGFQ
jgi:hypothetical protein